MAIQVGRTAFAVLAVGRHPLSRNFQRIPAWFVVSGGMWLAGGWADGTLRTALWLAALALDYFAPVCRFATPGLGRSSVREWTIAGEHLAERCQLFMIVALGESVLLTGATFSKLTPSIVTTAAFVAAFLGSAALWWIFRPRRRGSQSCDLLVEDPGRLGRSAYTYFHVPMVAGVILVAVGMS